MMVKVKKERSRPNRNTGGNLGWHIEHNSEKFGSILYCGSFENEKLIRQEISKEI
jgi:hypothetical protein